MIDQSGRFGARFVLPLRSRSLFQPVQYRQRVPGIGADPAVVDVLDRQAVQVVPAFAAFLPRHYQIGFLQHFEMLHHRAAIHVREGLAEHAGGAWAFLQQIQNLAAPMVRQSLENGVVV